MSKSKIRETYLNITNPQLLYEFCSQCKLPDCQAGREGCKDYQKMLRGEASNPPKVSSGYRYEYKGERKTLRQWSEQYHIPYYTLCKRLRMGWDIEKALTTPLRNERRHYYKDEYLSLKELSERTGVDYNKLCQRVNTYGWSITKAVEVE